MFTLLKGDCEHCAQAYRYSLLNAEFGDFSYAYCDACGKLATFSCSSSFLLSMPRLVSPNQVIDTSWEPYIRSCECGGSFRRSAMPRCVVCIQPLSAAYAAAHIEHNFAKSGRNWNWQGNWSASYCIDIEDPMHPGALRHVTDPFLDRTARAALPDGASRGWLAGLFRAGR